MSRSKEEFDLWKKSHKEAVDNIRKVCIYYDVAGRAVSNTPDEKYFIADAWYDSIIK